MYDTYIFDFYGTLVDIHTDENKMSFWIAFSRFCRKYGIFIRADKLRRMYRREVGKEILRTGRSTGYRYPEPDLLKVFCRLLPGLSSAQVREAAWQFRLLSRDRFEVYPHVREVLGQLKAEGKTICLLSNAQACFTDPELDESGLREYFDIILLSSDCRMKKPQPEFMEILLEGRDRKRCIMTGNDFESDAASAYACGVQAVFLNTYRQSEEEIGKYLKKYPGTYVIADGDIAKLREVAECRNG
ncbi:MAG: HAD family hydrolase [Solobacterium sp.]|nr:HAD family hydrolase [Solobacterium sp.]